MNGKEDGIIYECNEYEDMRLLQIPIFTVAFLDVLGGSGGNRVGCRWGKKAQKIELFKCTCAV
jgi:hypothetical protein